MVARDRPPLVLHCSCHAAGSRLNEFELRQLEGRLLERLETVTEEAERTRELRRRLRPPSAERDVVHAMLDSRLIELRASFDEAATALQAMSGDAFGTCATCGGPIGFAHLLERPWTTACRWCAREGDQAPGLENLTADASTTGSF